MTALLTALCIVALALGFVVWRIRRLDSKAKKKLIKQRVRAFYERLESAGLIPRTPGFVRDYHAQYRGLEALEKSYPLVQKECLELLARQESLTDIKELGGNYTQAGIHVIRWKSFMLKSGEFIEENCRLAPETARLLRGVPGLYTAFFSILEPRQYVTPHWGYYKGFVRYHLGVLIPDDNADGRCWLRVNDDPVANASRDVSAIEQCEKYYWHDGEGVVFDDTYLHDAANESDEVRVVLWLDLAKKLPWYVQPVNRLFLWIAHRDESVRRIRDRARVRL